MTKIPAKNVLDLRNIKRGGEAPIPEKKIMGDDQRIPCGWNAPEFIAHEKNVAWIGGLAIFIIGFAVYFLFTKNYLGALLMILAGILTGVWATRKPRTIEFKITSLGIEVASRKYPFEDIESFWILYDPPAVKEVILRTKTFWNSHLYLNIGKANPVEIRKILLKFLPEKEEQESLANVIARRLGF